MLIGKARTYLELLLAQTGRNQSIDGEMTFNVPTHLRQRKSPAQRRALLNDYDKQIKDQQKKRDVLHPNFHVQDSLERVRGEIESIDIILSEVRPEMKKHLQQFREVKRRRYSVFMDFFRVVEASIQEIYARLTSTARQPLGGNAYLSASNPQCPFLDGIVYSVVPPLKRHRTLEFLSGGEQTLAVVSLIFALNRGKPSPTIIFDEIDAALDQQNIRMLSAFLKSQSNERQLIIVSHREGLYSECDSLIGICRDPGSQLSMALFLPLKEIAEREEPPMPEEPETFTRISGGCSRSEPLSFLN
jgi:structural maintenance of chromosome 1